MIRCHILFLFVAAVAGSPRPHSSDAEEIQHVIQELLSSKANHQHVRNEHDHDLHHGKHHGSHDGTNIETLNLVFKHNKIIPTASVSKPITRTGGDGNDQLVPSSDLMCKLGARCGCGGKIGRCGCKGRSGGSCELDHDHEYENAVFLKPNPDYIKAEAANNRHSSLNYNNNRANPAIVKLLDDLEKSIVIQSNADQNLNELGRNIELHGRDDDDRKDNDDRDGDVSKLDGYIDSFLKGTEKALNDPENNDKNHIAYLRCCQNCARKSFYSGSSDDKAYLRCCKKCSKNKYFTADDRDRRDRDDDRDRTGTFNYKDNDVRDRSDPLDRARIFQINDNLNAIVLDVSDVDNVLNILNNGNKNDNAKSIQDYVKAVNLELQSKPKMTKYQNKLRPPTHQQKMKIKEMYRRSGKSGAEQYGVPFELDVQGLGQVNP